MTTPETLVADLNRAGVKLWAEDGKLRYRAPKGVLTGDLLEALRAGKDAVISLLQNESAAIVPDRGARNEPFPLTDVQAAYLLGRNDAFGFGGVACHVYVEVSYPSLDEDRLTAAWNRLIERHDMLRAVISTDGYQRVLPEVPKVSVPVTDLRGLPNAQSTLDAIREEFGHHVYDTTQWPLFDLRATRTDEHAVLHVSLDFLIADWASIAMLLGELEALHADPERELPELEMQFRDYLVTELKMRETGHYQRDRDYWTARLDELPPAPDLPMDQRAQEPSFSRNQLRLTAPQWEEFKRRTQSRGLTPSSTVLSAYAAVIERWSQASRFSLNLTVLNRLPLHPQVHEVVGDFTSVNLLAVDWNTGRTFAERAAVIGAQLFDDLDHRLYSGVEVIRELARRRGREAALMPIVFTSAIGIGSTMTGCFDGFGITQTPQVFIDCQAMDDADGLRVNWDIRDGVFPDGLVDDMFESFESLLLRLATSDDAWDGAALELPSWQVEERRAANATAAPLPDALLHQEVFAQAARTPARVAVIDPRGSVTYADLVARANAVAVALRAAGCEPGERVAIVMDKGIEQVSAVLGTLLAGAVYLPVDTVQPVLRREAILRDAEVRHVLTQSWVGPGIHVDVLKPIGSPIEVTPGDPDAAAYVIYTSGSTGKPKGVVISHRAALNTIVDINSRFGITADDRVLGVANLGFDLSVYDIFGPLSLGAALVYPDAARRADPSHWANLVAQHGVTLWNSVPALMQMLLTYLDSELPTLRLALLSGDWIPTTLPAEAATRLPGMELISLGGATEAAIWSNYHRIDGVPEGWHSIPYGKPLANQGFRVLDTGMQDCPVWTVGELFISGAGLAQGYLGDPETTAHRFVTHNGERLYRTGDLGRYRPGGDIEFLGRADTQVKIRGHRIELGEIEAALVEHPAIASAGVVVADGALFGVVETARVEPLSTDDSRLIRIASAARSTDHAIAAVLYRAAVASDRPLRILELGRLRDEVVDVLAGLDADYRLGVLDVDLDYRAQGFAPNTFDAIVATSFSSAFVDLLVPGGWLVVNGERPWEDSVLELPELFVKRVRTDRARVTTAELADFLALRLPEHMIPGELQVVDALPLTGNGKVDRRTLQAWRPTPVGDVAAEVPENELEEALAKRWAEALQIPVIGRTESFFTRGADSLIMARMAGRLREELPEAEPVPFDTLLRQLLNEPTVAQLAAFLRRKAEPEIVTASGSNAALVPFSTNGDGPVRVLFHAGLGTMECFRPLAARLVEQDQGPVLGIAIADTDVYLALDPSDVVGRLADDYTERLLAEGHTRFQLIGYCLGGMFATEVARRLAERGMEVEDLVLVSSHLVSFDIQDDLMFETLFVPNLGITLDQIGFGSVDPQAVSEAFPKLVRDNDGRVPEGSLAQFDPFFARLGALSQEERFARYAEAASMLPEMAIGMFRVFKQSFQSARFVPPPYVGDIRFLCPATTLAPGMTEQMLEFWREVCLGDFTVSNVDGNHFSCMNEPLVQQVAEDLK
ncbi:amino acid adenylation domain-containing protein [Allokutzneria sp. A3M-2-11 16]|uniref:non-ribosomal peptide synthetase n=1 Tax=Allokutzneria sp. A3M-2-11 16 TaxID=2962043 RepID=UPI0020B7DC43|nr:non-ribosomal peptide synthetase [Allokutzneria sp. A3M-2-11 16]MCP3801285.1 amino acid adenylation domain-containing protein [Allokutzneria sp. A3M-2-11 16]